MCNNLKNAERARKKENHGFIFIGGTFKMNYPIEHPGYDRLLKDIEPNRTIEIDENHPVLGQTIKDLFEVYADEVIKIG